MKTDFQFFKNVIKDLNLFFGLSLKYKYNLNKYLSLKNISNEEILDIKKNLCLNYSTKESLDEIDIEFKNYFINKLSVDSFYSNHELFNKLGFDYNNESFPLVINESSFFNNFNIDVKFVNIDTLKNAHENKPIQQAVLLEIYLKSIINKNTQLFNWVNPLVILDENLKYKLFNLILNDSNAIKDNLLIKNTINELFPLNIFIDKLIDFSLNKKNIKNIENFYNISIFNIPIPLFNFPKEISEKWILKNKEVVTNEKIMEYYQNYHGLRKPNEKLNRILFLNKNKLLNSSLLSNNEIIDEIIKNFEKFKPLLSEQQLSFVITEHKKNFIKSFNSIQDKIEFINNPFLQLSDIEIELLITENTIFSYPNNKIDFYSSLEKKSISIAIEKINNEDELIQFIEGFNKDYYDSKCYDQNTDNIENKMLDISKYFFNVLFQKYPEYMNNKNNLFKHAEKCQFELFVYTYLNTFLENCNDNKEDIKKEFLSHLKIFDYSISSPKCPLIVNWLIKEDLIVDFLKNDNNSSLFTNKSLNVWMPLFLTMPGLNPNNLILKTTYSFISNDELFKYMLNNFTLTETIQQQLCNSVFSIDNTDLALALVNKDIFPNEYYIEYKFKDNMNKSAQIMMKGKLKEQLDIDLNLVKEIPKKRLKI